MALTPIRHVAVTSLRQKDAARVLTDYLDALDRAADEGADRLAEVFEASPPGVGVHEINSAARVLRVSREELRILGYEEAEMVGRPVWEIIVMKDASRRAIDQKIKGERELKPFVRSFLRKDGSAIALLLADRHLRDGHGNVVGLRTAMTEVRSED
jgi:PAS domain S-box-containing protein